MDAATERLSGVSGDGPAGRSPTLMLVVATVGFAINFWAWALLSPLGPKYRTSGDLGVLSESDVALLVAVPVVVGSLGRIVVGALTDRFGGRVMFPLVSAATMVPVLFLAFFALDSYALLLVGGVFLGIGGTIFAAGVPFVSAWFPPHRRGFATGIFGAGMVGTAISALTTVKIWDNVGHRAPFLLAAAALAVYAVVAWLVLRDAPGRQVPTTGTLTRMKAVLQLPVTWQAGALYAVAFGGYVAFSVYLPSYLITAHDLGVADASNRMAGFVAVAVVLRPLGGWLCDRFDTVWVLAACFALTALCAGVAATDPPMDLRGTTAFLLMAAALGAGSGATFALIAQATDPAQVGGVSGLVGAAGGLGGFAPPLLMGYIYGRTESYAIGLWMLCVAALLLLALTLTRVRKLLDLQPTQEEAA